MSERTAIRIVIVAALAAAAFPATAGAQSCGTRCGVERWAVKTFTDADTGRVDLTPRDASVLELRELPRPPRIVAGRRSEVERRTYRVRALLIGWKHERGDDDLHLVIADSSDPGSTMIVEIPSARCARVCSSRLVGMMTDARNTTIAELGPPSSSFHLVHPARMVTITGIGFFDFLHGQTGVAPNGIELHPVLGIHFRARDVPDTAAIRALATDLAADSMRGRGPWTPENAAAAHHLAAELTRFGAKPLQGNSLLVPFVTEPHPRDTVYNVVAVFPARSGTITDQLVGITAHLDHLGVGAPDASGDSIYNGFLDDGIGMAVVLDVARRYAAHPGDRSLVVLFFNLEEQGLLGSLAWARAPGARDLMRRFQLVLGVDAGSPAGEALNWELMGAFPEHPAAHLADSLARSRGWTTRATPARGISDAYIFSLASVPILFPIPGDQWRGYTPEERAAAMARFDHYHQPADQADPGFPLIGTLHFADWLWQIVRGASSAPTTPR